MAAATAERATTKMEPPTRPLEAELALVDWRLAAGAPVELLE